MKRAEAKSLAESNGAKVGGSVTGKTDILVAAPDAGKKIADAEAKGVEVWTEDQFMAAVGGGAAAAPAAPAPKKVAVKKAPPKKAEPEDVEMAGPAASPAKGGGGGGRKADRSVPNGAAYNVVDDFDCKLMQTNIGDSNNNKFYIIQILRKGGELFTWNRWGRLGVEGQNKLQACSNMAAAEKDFCKKFKDKTKNNWEDRANFVKHDGKYQFVEIEADGGDGGGDALLGKLTEAQINKGQEVLADIRSVLEGSAAGVLITLSGSYYSLIPTQSGFKAPPKIDNFNILQEKENLLEFWLRMGFEDLGPEISENPLEGLKDRPIPLTLIDAAKAVSDKGSIDSSTKRGAELAKKKAGKPRRTMGPERYAAIVLYTGNSIYKSLNEALRVKHTLVPKYFDYLRLFLEAMACLPKQTATLWRGIGVDLFDEYEEGKIITWWSVSSCTSDKSVAENFMNSLGGGCSFITLNCNSAVDIAPLSVYSSEKESLLAPGTKLKVLSRTRKGKVAHIHVEEVGNALDDFE